MRASRIDSIHLRQRKAQWGVTLLELLITMTIAAVLASVGIPAFNNFTRNQDRLSGTNELVYSLQLARGEALKLAQFVTVCRVDEDKRDECGGAGEDWGVGWLVFANTAAANADTVDAGEEIIYRYVGAGDNVDLSTDDIDDGFLMFWPSGDLGVDATWTWCDDRGVDYARAVNINQAGRARIAELDVDGGDLECPE